MKLAFSCVLVSLFAANLSFAAGVAHPSKTELENLLGQEISHSVKVVEWNAPDPRQTNLDIYAVQPTKFDAARLQKMADAFGVKGTITPLPSSNARAPGYWIKEPNPTNALMWKCVIWSHTGELVYFSGDDGNRRDSKTKKPNPVAVPSPQEALKKSLTLLPVLGLSTNDLDYSDGQLRWGSGDRTISFNDRLTGERKSVVTLRTVGMAQSLPNGGRVYGTGGGGAINVGFVSEGKLASVELLFRQVKSIDSAKPLGKNDIIKLLKNGKSWTVLAAPPKDITVTNCSLVYPQGNSSMKQSHLYPFYWIRGFSVSESETNYASFFVPLSW